MFLLLKVTLIIIKLLKTNGSAMLSVMLMTLLINCSLTDMARNQTKEMRVLMQRNGFTLARETKHLIWKHDTGVVMTTSKTPSDNYAIAQASRQIRRTLGTLK